MYDYDCVSVEIWEVIDAGLKNPYRKKELYGLVILSIALLSFCGKEMFYMF